MNGDMRWSKVLQQIPKQTVCQTEATSLKEWDMPVAHEWMVVQAEIDVATAEHMIQWWTNTRSTWLEGAAEFFKKLEAEGKI